MAFFSTVSAGERQRSDLARRLRKLESVFRIPELQRESLRAEQVVEYFEHCHDAYRKYHSSEGAVHMALNDADRFDPDGFYGQARLFEQGWASAPDGGPKDVLEIAFGQGFNLAYLARRHPRRRFAGIDITPAHLELARSRMQREGLGNVDVALGDLHRLPYRDASFDEVLCLEAFCYATDLRQALGEVARVLRPGGRFTLFDGYLLRPPQSMSLDEALASELVARGMAIEQLQVLDELLGVAKSLGLQTRTLNALEERVLPNLRKLERLTGAIIRFPWLGRRALARRNPMRGRNILSGYLMCSTVALGLIGYRHIVLQKD